MMKFRSLPGHAVQNIVGATRSTTNDNYADDRELATAVRAVFEDDLEHALAQPSPADTRPPAMPRSLARSR